MAVVRVAIVSVVAACLIGCGGGPTLAGNWRSDQSAPELLLKMARDGSYSGTLTNSEGQSTPITGRFTVEGDMIKLDIGVRGETQGRQLIGTVAEDSRTFTLKGFGVMRKN